MLEITNPSEFFPNCEVYTFNNDDEWHNLRSKGIGGSEAGIILNINNYTTPHQLWCQKVGITEREFITNEAIEKGNRLEQPLIDVFEALYKHKYKVYNTKNISLKSKKYSFMNANLDGALVDTENKKGILEIKSTTIQRMSMLEEWRENTMPMQYYCQVLHYLEVTDFDFVIVFAILDFPWMDEEGKQETRVLRIDKDGVLEDITMIVEKEQKFWDMVVNKKEPEILNRTIRI